MHSHALVWYLIIHHSLIVYTCLTIKQYCPLSSIPRSRRLPYEMGRASARDGGPFQRWGFSQNQWCLTHSSLTHQTLSLRVQVSRTLDRDQICSWGVRWSFYWPVSVNHEANHSAFHKPTSSSSEELNIVIGNIFWSSLIDCWRCYLINDMPPVFNGTTEHLLKGAIVRS